MVSSPEDLEIAGRLSFEVEEDQIIQSFGKLYEHGLVQIDFTEDGSLETLERKLADNHYHILHFSGHGTYQKGTGYLQLEDPFTMQTRNVTGITFAQALKKKPEHLPALVMLSSCDSGQGKVEGEVFSGISNRLLQVGIPAVVAMSWKVSDHFATVFAAEFYRQVAEKTPLQRAFQEALLHMRQEEIKEYQNIPGLEPHQWLIPQLYFSRRCDHLVDWEAPRQQLTFSAYKFVTGKDRLLLAKKKNYQFIGRRRERKQALPLFREKTPILLKGQGGVGKTALAEHLVLRLIAADARVQPFVFDETTGSMEMVINRLVEFLQKEKRDFLIRKKMEDFSEKATEQLLWLFQHLDEACRPVFVFDNLESFQVEPGGPFKAEHTDLLEVIQLLYQNRWFPLLLTGRYPLADFPKIEILDLNQVRFADFWKKCHQLTLAELRDQLRREPEQKVHSSAGGDEKPTFREMVTLLHRTFGGNYRVLEFFDELYQQKRTEILDTLNQLSEYLATQTGDLLQRVSEDLVFTELLDLLTTGEQWALRTLTYFRRPVLPLALEMQDPDRPVGGALARLHQLTLSETHREAFDQEQSLDYYYVTPIVRQLLARATKTPDRVFAQRQAGRYYEYVDQHINYRTYADLEEAFFHFLEASEREKVNDIGDTLAGFFYGRNLYRNALEYALATEKLLGAALKPSLLNRIGLILLIFGRIDQALTYFKKKLPLDREIGDRSGEGTTLNNISQIYDAKGDYDTALQYLQQSLKIRQEIGDRRGEGTTLNNISQIYDAKGDYDTALQYLQQSLKIQQEIGDRSGEGTTLNNISQIFKARGDYDTALQYLQQSLKIRQEIGDRRGEGTTLNNISQIYDAKGDYDTALQYLQQSLKIQQEIGDRSGEGTTLNNISQIFKARGDYDTALQYLQQSLKIQQEIGDRSGEGTTLNNISQIFKARGDYDTALQYLQQSLKIQQEIGDRSGEGTTLNNISQIFKARGDYDTALQYLQQSLKIQQEIGDRSGEGTTLNNISQIFKARGDYDTALQYLQQSLKIRQEIGDRSGEGTTLNNLATTAHAKGDYDTALQYLQQSLKIQQEIGDINGIAVTMTNMGAMLYEQKRLEDAIPLLFQAYQIFKQIGSPNAKAPAGYLQAIGEQIGEARFRQIIQELGNT